MRRKVSNQLRLLDVLAEAYPPPQVNEVPLLNRGAILNDRYIEKLTSFAEATSEQHPIPVYIPTPLATIWRMVSSEPPSSERCRPEPERCTDEQNSSTWSRKQ